jgi:hypothetical protein
MFHFFAVSGLRGFPFPFPLFPSSPVLPPLSPFFLNPCNLRNLWIVADLDSGQKKITLITCANAIRFGGGPK